MFMLTNSEKKTADARDAHDAHGPKIQQEWSPTPQAIILEYMGDCLIGTTCGAFQHSISDTKICHQKSIKDAKIMEGQCRKAWWVRDRDTTELSMSVTQGQEVTEARTFESFPICRFGECRSLPSRDTNELEISKSKKMN